MPTIRDIIMSTLIFLTVLGLSVVIVGYVYLHDYNLANLGWVNFGGAIILLTLINKYWKK